MKKVDLWIVIAVALAIVVNPDESNTYGLMLLWGNVLAAICTKAIINENTRNNNPYDKTTKRD